MKNGTTRVTPTLLSMVAMGAMLVAPDGALAAECAHKSVAECADLLAEKVDTILKEHDALMSELQKTKAQLQKQIASVPRVATGHTAINKTIGHVHVEFSPGTFTKVPQVEIAITGFFGGLETSNYYRVYIYAPQTNVTTNGFDIFMDPKSGQPDSILWIAVQKPD